MERIAIIFPGHGSHFVGMGRGLFNQHEIARHTFEEANDALGFDLAKVCFDGPFGELHKPVHTLPAILVVGVASFRVYMKEIGVAPQFLAGHSLGEYSALTCAGAMKFVDAVKILHYRGLLWEEAAAADIGAMSIVEGVSREVLEAECTKASVGGRFVAVSCYNSPHQFDISGQQDAVIEVEEGILEKGGQVTPLLGSVPNHSPLMQPAAMKLKEELQKYSYSHLRYPVIANVDALPYRGPESMVENLVQHYIKPVLWPEIVAYLRQKGVTLTVELGMRNILSNLVKANCEEIEALCFGVKEDKQALIDLLSAPGARKKMPTLITRCLAVGGSTPNRNWESNEYHEGVIKPYRRLQEIQAGLDRDGRLPSAEEMREALEKLQLILRTKRIPLEEQAEWFDQILEETGTRYLFKDFLLAGGKKQTA